MPDYSLELALRIAQQLLVGLFGLSFLVFIHEGGHFLMAKKLGVKVNTFAIGFGKTLFSFKRGETEYCLKAIPFGGYVAMAGEQPGESNNREPGEFASKSIPARMSIALAGPAVNIAFAFLAMVVLYQVGVEEPVTNKISVGKVLEDSPAMKAGIQRGDTITHLEGKPIKNLDQFLQRVSTNAGVLTAVKYKRGDSVVSVQVTPVMHEMGFAWMGIIPGETSVLNSGVSPGKPAERAGLKKGDQILKVDGMEIPDPTTFIEIINASNGEVMQIEVLRDSQYQTFAVAAEKDSDDGRFRIGMAIQMLSRVPTHVVTRSFSQSLVESARTNLDYSLSIFRFLNGILRGQIKLKALSGPVGILQVIGNSFRKSIQTFIQFLALISLNLGLINLLPLIITDGGIVLFLILEALRGKPLDVKTQLRINQIAVSLFIALAIFITFQDFMKFHMFLD